MSESKLIVQETWMPSCFVAAEGLFKIGDRELTSKDVFSLLELMQHMYSSPLDSDRLAMYNRVCITVLESDRIIRNMMRKSNDDRKV